MYLLFRITHHLCAGSHWVSERGGRSPRCRAAVRPEHCSAASKDDMIFYQTIYLLLMAGRLFGQNTVPRWAKTTWNFTKPYISLLMVGRLFGQNTVPRWAKTTWNFTKPYISLLMVGPAVRPFRGEQRRHDILPNHITFTDGREKILKQLNRSKLPWSMIRPVSCRSFSISFLSIFFPGLSVHLELLWCIVSVCKSALQHFWAESLLTLFVITIYKYFSDTLLLKELLQEFHICM